MHYTVCKGYFTFAEETITGRMNCSTKYWNWSLAPSFDSSWRRSPKQSGTKTFTDDFTSMDTSLDFPEHFWKIQSVLLSAVTEIQCIYQRYFKTSGLKCWSNIFKEKGLKILSDKQDLFCRVWCCNLTVMWKALYDILITFIGNTFAGESFNNN